MTHKITAYVVDDEDIHPTHNPFSNAHAMSPELSKSKKRRARRTISDSGASKYMFSGKSWFRNYTPSHNVSIRVAEGSSAKALGTGDVGPLKNVLHVEGLIFDLVSEPALARARMSGTWSGLSRVVKQPDGKVFFEATLCNDDLYEVNPMYL